MHRPVSLPQPHPRLPASTSAAVRAAPARGPAPCAAVPTTVVTPDSATGVFEELAAGQTRKYIMISGKVRREGLAQGAPIQTLIRPLGL
jgi:hypothetical protein